MTEVETKKEIVKDLEDSGVPKDVAKIEEAIDEKEMTKVDEEKELGKKSGSSKGKVEQKIKKTEAIVRAENIPISTKDSMAVGKFIKGKTISKAIRDLERVILEKKAVSIKGEHAHKRGKRMSGGIYPKKVSKNFIILLKSLASNSAEINEPVIVEVVANIGERPYGRFGRYRRKRTHIFIKAVEKKTEKKSKSKNKEKK